MTTSTNEISSEDLARAASVLEFGSGNLLERVASTLDRLLGKHRASWALDPTLVAQFGEASDFAFEELSAERPDLAAAIGAGATHVCARIAWLSAQEEVVFGPEGPPPAPVAFKNLCYNSSRKRAELLRCTLLAEARKAEPGRMACLNDAEFHHVMSLMADRSASHEDRLTAANFIIETCLPPVRFGSSFDAEQFVADISAGKPDALAALAAFKAGVGAEQSPKPSGREAA